MPVLDVDALSERRREVMQAKADAADFATQAVREFAAVAEQLQVPRWNAASSFQKYHEEAGFRGGHVLLRDGGQNEFWMGEGFGAIIGADGRHLLRNKLASAEDIGQWVAAHCGFDLETVQRVFTMALTDVPLSTSQV